MFKTSVHTAFLIDDNEVDLFVQSKFIQLSQFASHIITFQSAKDALQALATSQAPDIIFLDLNMPGMGGFDFLDQLRSRPVRPDVIILTSSNNQSDRERARTYGNVLDFVTKPLTMEGLESLRTVLRHSA
ncbi:MAG: response regulator [Cyclobacteriaceae bacterium]|jgi:CheY-like chemotaxis protein|nr:response regulator [Cyclobacteriaceae bacterium]